MGPDLFLYDFLTMDVEKMARRGVFADLEPYFEADHLTGRATIRPSWRAACGMGTVWSCRCPIRSLCCIHRRRRWRKPAFRWKTAIRLTAFWTRSRRWSRPRADAGSFPLGRGILLFPYNSGLPYVDYGPANGGPFFPELEQGASIYKNLKPVLAPGLRRWK